MDRIQLQRGQVIKIGGLPFALESDTVVIGHQKNFDLIDERYFRSFGVPIGLNVAQDDDSETSNPSSSSINCVK
jgi:hypothetical protein